MTSPQNLDLLSHFWSPLCAIGVAGPERPNAQICLSVFGASIVPERPQLLVSLSKTNYTHNLVADTGRLTITLLSDRQAGLLAPLGLQSGRDRDKLAGIEHELAGGGLPWFPGGVGVMRCDVLRAHDLGDATAFLVGIRERWDSDGALPLRWADARTVVGDDFLARWAEKSAREQEAARAAMVWE